MNQEVKITLSITADANLSKEEISNLINEVINDNTAKSNTHKRILIPRIDISNIKEEWEIYQNENTLETAFYWMENDVDLVFLHPKDHDDIFNFKVNEETIVKVGRICEDGTLDLYIKKSGEFLFYEISPREVSPKDIKDRAIQFNKENEVDQMVKTFLNGGTLFINDKSKEDLDNVYERLKMYKKNAKIVMKQLKER